MIKGIVFTSFGALFLARGLLRPVRAVVKRGEVRRCAGRNAFDVCDTSMSIGTPTGEEVHSNTSGKVLMVGDDYIHVMSRDEPVILMYQGVIPIVRANQHVSPGQQLGRSSGTVNFSVTQMGPGGVTFIEPASWLVSRGYKAVLKPKANNLWCTKGREIVVPSSARQKCDFKSPEKSGFALLPVSIEMN
jgi:hypothetical protein